MFQRYREILKNALKVESIIKDKYDSLREKNVIEIQSKMREEALNISKNQHIKDYNPIQYYNSITILKHKHDEILKNEKEEYNDLREETDKLLFEVMNIKYPVTKIYKIISCDMSANVYNRVCRVWFTLVPIDNNKFKCNAGDPIEIEWINLSKCENNDDLRSNDNKTIRTSEGINGLKIPEFVNNYHVKHNNFYDINNWGENSNQKTWWLQWLKINRPIPELDN